MTDNEKHKHNAKLYQTAPGKENNGAFGNKGRIFLNNAKHVEKLAVFKCIKCMLFTGEYVHL